MRIKSIHATESCTYQELREQVKSGSVKGSHKHILSAQATYQRTDPPDGTVTLQETCTGQQLGLGTLDTAQGAPALFPALRKPHRGVRVPI